MNNPHPKMVSGQIWFSSIVVVAALGKFYANFSVINNSQRVPWLEHRLKSSHFAGAKLNLHVYWNRCNLNEVFFCSRSSRRCPSDYRCSSRMECKNCATTGAPIEYTHRRGHITICTCTRWKIGVETTKATPIIRRVRLCLIVCEEPGSSHSAG